MMLSPEKLFVIFLIGLLVLGPERLPLVARKIGSAMHDARRMLDLVHAQVEAESKVITDATRPDTTPITPEADR